jgi:hypothetical protein
MSNNQARTDILNDLDSVFEIVDECLSEWKGDENLQFPILVPMVALKAKWDDKEMRYYDPIIRFYVRKHPDWHVTRGAHGGIMPATEKQKKDAAKLAKETAKAQVKAALAAKLATLSAGDSKAPVTSTNVDDDDDNDDLDSSDSE